MPRALIAVLLVACGSQQGGIAPPPPYTPVATPEAPTACPDQRHAAQTAREDLLERPGTATRERAAELVFADADCERAAFDALPIEPDREERMIEALRAARLQYQNAVNLYQEVGNYEVLRWTVASRSRLGALHAAFAERLRAVGAPTDSPDAADRVDFVSRLAAFAETYDHEAAAAYRSAVETAALVPSLIETDPAVSGWVQAACQALAYLDPSARAELTACN